MNKKGKGKRTKFNQNVVKYHKIASHHTPHLCTLGEMNRKGAGGGGGRVLPVVEFYMG